MKIYNLLLCVAASFFVVAGLNSTSRAHFPWLAMDSDGKVVYFFGETVAQRDYKLPEKLSTATIHSIGADGKSSPIEMTTLESDDFIGRQSVAIIGPVQQIQSHVTYGIHGGGRLDYYTLHIPGSLPKSFETVSYQAAVADFQSYGIDTEDGVTIRLYWKGKPLTDTEVRLFSENGNESSSKKTNNDGEVSFSDSLVDKGMNAILVGFTRKDEAGKLGDREYKSASYYLTMTFNDPESPIKPLKRVIKTNQLISPSIPPVATSRAGIGSKSEKPHADLPLPLTSFGAVRSNKTLFVYGGHIGEAHHYSTKEQSDSLLALDLSRPESDWQVLSRGRRLQGLGLVSHGENIIRVGGFEAVNGVDEEHDLRSTDEVMAFNLRSKTWSALPALPEPRSSHDALIVENRLYVIGGWTLCGEESHWLTTAWSIELPAEGKTWEPVPRPNFARRAIALAATGSQIYAIGGMNEKGGPTTEVDYLDLESQTWNSAPQLIGKPMNGFGAAAWHHENSIIATTSEGEIQRFIPGSSSWEIIGKTQDARFFHRLLPYDNDKFIALGGANMQQQKKFPNVEVITIP